MSALCIIPHTRDANRSDPSYKEEKGATYDDHPIYHIRRVNWLIAIMDYCNHARDSNFQAFLIHFVTAGYDKSANALLKKFYGKR